MRPLSTLLQGLSPKQNREKPTRATDAQYHDSEQEKLREFVVIYAA